ncbi:unannotated protein [freshwater metagenome]|uniref:Unannotated protein n=1 Tax=freshwater metagenome TaxID=449393 RepID=A0A6J7L3U9_9ZZZZ
MIVSGQGSFVTARGIECLDVTSAISFRNVSDGRGEIFKAFQRWKRQIVAEVRESVKGVADVCPAPAGVLERAHHVRRERFGAHGR